MDAEIPADTDQYVVRRLSRGAKAGVLAALLVAVWAVMTLLWPASVSGPNGLPFPCGTAASPGFGSGDSCGIETARLRTQGLALLAAAGIIGVGSLALFGLEDVTKRD